MAAFLSYFFWIAFSLFSMFALSSDATAIVGIGTVMVFVVARRVHPGYRSNHWRNDFRFDVYDADFLSA